MFETYRKSGPLYALIFLIFIPIGIAYFVATIYMGMEGIYNVMALTMLSSVGAFVCFLMCIIAVYSVKNKFAEKSQYRILVPITGEPVVVETVSHKTAPSMSISSNVYKVVQCDKRDYDLTTGLVFKAYDTEKPEIFVLSGLDIKGELDNKIFLNGTTFFDEKQSEWIVKPELDYEDEQKAYMSILIKSLKNLVDAEKKVIMDYSTDMSKQMTNMLSIANEAYNMIVPIREAINIPVVKGENTDIERIKAEKSALSAKKLRKLEEKLQENSQLALANGGE